jgi:hypothetical protein
MGRRRDFLFHLPPQPLDQTFLSTPVPAFGKDKQLSQRGIGTFRYVHE